MAAERPPGIDTDANVLALLNGARVLIAKGWCTYYSHRETTALKSIPIGCKLYGQGDWIDVPGTECWSLTGAIGEAGRQLKLCYQVGSYNLLSKLVGELKKTNQDFYCYWEDRPERTKVEVLELLDVTIERLTHSQSALAATESEKTNDGHDCREEAKVDDGQGLLGKGNQA